MARTLPLGYRPDIIVIRADDMPWDGMSANAMPSLWANYSGSLIDCPRAYNNISVCCPTRVAGLSGLTADRHGVHENDAGAVWNTSNSWLWAVRNVGYYVGCVGKFLNDNGGNSVFAKDDTLGCDFRKVYNGDPDYYDYDRWEATTFGPATAVHYGNANADYSGRVENADALQFYTLAVASGKPIALYWAPKIPHRPGGGADPTPDPAYTNLAVTATDHPTFGLSPSERNCPQNMIDEELTPWDAAHITSARTSHINSLRTIRSLDDGIAALMAAVVTAGRLAQTIFIFTTDNAHAYGEFRLDGKGNNHVTASSMLMKAIIPGVASGTRFHPFADYDIAPTVCHAAGARMNVAVDGKSMIASLLDNSKPHTDGVYMGKRHGGPGSFQYVGYETSEYSCGKLLQRNLDVPDPTNETWVWQFADSMATCVKGQLPAKAEELFNKIRAANRLTRFY